MSGSGGGAEHATGAAPRVSALDSFRFNLSQTVPAFVQGTFSRRPRVTSFFARYHPDPQGVRLVSRLRARYRSDYLWLSVLGKASLLVLDPDGVRAVLGGSPDPFGPPDVKLRGMSHFQPGALTISAGEEWRRRRRFHDEVLAVGSAVHPRAADFLAVVDAEVERLLERAGRTEKGGRVTWPDLHALFQRIAAGVVFGASADGAPDVLDTLTTLMRESNRVFGLKPSPQLAGMQERIRALLCASDAGGLSPGVCPHVAPGDPVPVAGQVPHWLFALKDTLAVNCANTLAMIVAHPDVERRVVEEAAAADLSDPASVDGMALLEGCLQDTMRLLPTTPMLVRAASRDAEVCGRAVPEGAQIVIHNGFNHRNPDALSDPDRFQPESWERGRWSYRFNHLSNGPQACAGRDIVLLLGKAVLGRLFTQRRWGLHRPRLVVAGRVPHAVDHYRLMVEMREHARGR